MAGFIYILKGLLIGVIVSLPIGPIMMLTVQKSVNDGRKAGFSCGLGATVVDTTCALVSAFALGAIGSFVERHTSWIEIIGGLIIAGVGVGMLLTRVGKERRVRSYSPRNFVRAATMGFSNPAALAVMLAMFAGFKMNFSPDQWPLGLASVLAVGVGSASFWYIFSRVIAHIGDRFKFSVLVWISRLAGAGVILFGLYLTFKGIFSL